MSAAVLVRRFYDDVWNARSGSAAREILSADLSFRGSVGVESRGVEAFLAYVDEVHGALANYSCQIEDLIEHGDRAVARVRFGGRHVASLLGVAATGRHVAWTGAAFFTTRAGRIAAIWVLGDLLDLRTQLERPE